MSHSKILSTANNDFTVSLYQALYPSVPTKNLIFSPFSLHAVLGMVGQGARGDTRTELLKGLKFTENDGKVICNGYNLVITGFEKSVSSETFTLLTANRVYSQTGFGLNPKFVATLRKNFKTDFVQLDFSTKANCKVAAEAINEWVEATTKNKIKNLVSPDAFGPMTSLVLVNGIYFKGLWKHPFNRRLTSRKSFHVTPTKQVEVVMMQTNVFNFMYRNLPKLHAEAIALSYEGGRLSMVIIVPNDIDGLGRIQDNIGSILHNGKSFVWDSMTSERIRVSLPKFKVETTIGNLKQVLENLGIKSMFSETEADFSGIPNDGEDSENLFVSRIIQKAFIEVNEEGAEAAAVTYNSNLRCSAPGLSATMPFVVDRPFYFQIVDHANSDLVIFSGHVYDPTM